MTTDSLNKDLDEHFETSTPSDRDLEHTYVQDDQLRQLRQCEVPMAISS